MNWKNAVFLYSASSEQSLTPSNLPEIAFVGRSNVGKSSLISHLLDHNQIARVSKTPGKTKLINFFNVDNHFLLVDLPGYGFAKVSKKERENWNSLMEHYFRNRPSLVLVCHLMDARHPPSQEDLLLNQWINKPMVVVYTKTDLIKSPPALTSNLFPTLKTISYSIKNGSSRKNLRHLLENFVESLKD